MHARLTFLLITCILMTHAMGQQKDTEPTATLPADLIAVEDAAIPPTGSLPEESQTAQGVQRAEAKKRGLPLEVKTRKLGMWFRYIPSGKAVLGSPSDEAQRRGIESLPRSVTFEKGMYIGTFEVTQAEWERVMGFNPSDNSTSGEEAPVEMVSLLECERFVINLCKLEGVPEGSYRLLTESEWEYACRAGSPHPFAFGKRLSSNLANFDGRYPYGGGAKDRHLRKTVAVGSYPANGFGLYDMHGIVYEWTSTQAEPDSERNQPPEKTKFFIKGGSTNSAGKACRSASRVRVPAERRGSGTGFRVMRFLP